MLGNDKANMIRVPLQLVDYLRHGPPDFQSMRSCLECSTQTPLGKRSNCERTQRMENVKNLAAEKILGGLA